MELRDILVSRDSTAAVAKCSILFGVVNGFFQFGGGSTDAG